MSIYIMKDMYAEKLKCKIEGVVWNENERN